MSIDAVDFETLLLRFEELGHRDRKAVLRQLTSEDRPRIEIAIAAKAEAQRREADQRRRAGRQFAGYSAWLSPIVQSASTPATGTTEQLAPATRQAIADIHRALHAEDPQASEGLFASMRRWTNSILTPKETTRS